MVGLEGGVFIGSVFLTPDRRPGAVAMLCAALLASATVTTSAGPASAPAASLPAQDTRPRLAVVGFEADPNGDARDAWIPVALEELLCRRLQRVPALLVVPAIRLYQARDELAEPGAVPPPWAEVVRGLGATHVLTGRCSGPDSAVRVELRLGRVGQAGGTEERTAIGPRRVFDALDDATRWALEHLELTPLPNLVAEQVFAPPSHSPLAAEYYARAVAAARADKPREALRYAATALDADKRFRPALMALAQLEAQLGPAGRGSASRRLRALNDLARMDGDAFDRVRAEIGQALLLQADGAFDAGYTRAETALAVAFEHRDLYGQMAAVTAIAELYLSRPLPLTPGLAEEARQTFARASVTRAAEWQGILLDMLDGLGDTLASLPATNRLAVIYEQLGQPEQALEMHQRTLALATTLNSRRHQATAWLFIGQWYRKQQRWEEALDAVSRCLALADETSKPAVRIARGQVYQALRLDEQALAEFELAYDQVRRTDNLVNQLACLREVADARMRLGRRENAIVALQEAIDIAHVLELRDEQKLREQLDRWKAGGT